MITLLSKLFIENNKDYSSLKVRQSYGILCGAVGIFFNLILFTGKFIIGLLSNSIAITADAFNNLSDAGSSVISLIGFKLSSQKPDPDHPFGHGRMEYISGLIISIIILFMAYELVKSSIDKILHPEAVEASLFTFLILLFSIMIKLYMSFYNSRLGKKFQSSAMKATAVDSASDTLATTVVLIATLCNYFWGWKIDGYCGVAVGLFIAYAGFSSLKETISPLLGQKPSEEFVEQVKEIVLSHDLVLGIHDLIVHDYGPGRIMISLHAEVPANGDILSMHDTIDNIEKDLRNELGCDATIHMDPIQNEDAETIHQKEFVLSILNDLDPDLSLHDFRIVKGTTHTNLIFDVLVPYRYKLSDEKIVEYIESEVKANYPNYFCVIDIDKDYATVSK